METITHHKKRIQEVKLKSISKWENIETDITPKPTDSTRKANIKKVNILFKKVNTPDYNPVQEEQENKTKAKEYATTQSRVIAISHDIKTKAYNIPIQPNKPKIDYKKDTTEYLLINKQVRYKDITPLQILKILYAKHKITKWLYRDTVRRIKTGQQPKQKIRIMLNTYWKNQAKAQTGKNTISNLTKQQIESKRVRLKQKVNNTIYAIAIKNKPMAFSYELLRGETKRTYAMTNTIEPQQPITQQPPTSTQPTI